MSSKREHPIQALGFWMFGFLSVVLAVLRFTVAGYWSWWRVMLPFLGFLFLVETELGDLQSEPDVLRLRSIPALSQIFSVVGWRKGYRSPWERRAKSKAIETPLPRRSAVYWSDRLLSRHRGGVDRSTSEMNSGDGSGRLLNFQRRASRNPRA